MYAENGNKSVILVGHSMGCIYSYYLLLNQSQEWKNKYIHSWFTVAAPFAGSTTSWRSIVVGDNLHIIIFNPKTFQPVQETLSGIYFILPNADRFKDMVILRTADRNYTSNDYDQLFDLIGNPTGKKIWKATRGFLKGYPYPGVSMHCLKGKGVPTAESVDLSSPNSSRRKAAAIDQGDGDGTVNAVSADVCMEWRNHVDFYSHDFNGIDHAELVRHPDVVKYIVDQVTLPDV